MNRSYVIAGLCAFLALFAILPGNIYSPFCSIAKAESYLNYYYGVDSPPPKQNRFRQVAEALTTAVEGTTGALLMTICAIGGIVGAACGAMKIARNSAIGLLATLALRHSARDLLLADVGNFNAMYLLFLGLLGAGAFIWYSSGKTGKKDKDKGGGGGKASKESVTWRLSSGRSNSRLD